MTGIPNGLQQANSGTLAMPATRFPRWPQVDEAAEYHEIPPEHFLAQAGPCKAGSSSHSQDKDTASNSSDRFTGLSKGSASISSRFNSNSADADAAQTSITTATPRNLDRIFQPWLPDPDQTLSEHDRSLPDVSTLAAADFDVDVRTGFLPPEPPLARLPAKFALWEQALEQAHQTRLQLNGLEASEEERIAARAWRQSIREMPVLAVNAHKLDMRHARRAHLVLSFLAHFYLHSQPKAELQRPEHATSALPSWVPSFMRADSSETEMSAKQTLADQESIGQFLDSIPAGISVPWVEISEVVGLPPILTYATTVLWNWKLIDPAGPLTMDNVTTLETFTGTVSEQHFYLTSLFIEMRGVEALTLMRQSLDEIFLGDRIAARRLTMYLRRLANVIDDLTTLLANVRDHCNPAEFYWAIRPWFRGSDSSVNGRGWHYEGIDSASVRRQLSGPSAGQSSLIHALDVFLDVDHSRTRERVRPHQPRPNGLPPSDATFMERMSFYMPKHHRNFLNHLRSLSFDDDVVPAMAPSTTAGHENESEKTLSPVHHPVRRFVLQRMHHDHELSLAYDHTLKALKGLRDEHMRIAALYIISQARRPPPTLQRTVPPPEVACIGGPASNDPLVGTGGTDLVMFLRDCRANTLDALINES